ncbi:hypothetical protein L2E82_11793 [Cichorium intybus]|uniref:Uncharacterized protein n=1 Tax=Cichorium intybus TaxID=13427 RepID=A0ACB9GE18_CICIN|nr:hypothetical protein L2E82_11793 [Cichorium intybus]
MIAYWYLKLHELKREIALILTDSDSPSPQPSRPPQFSPSTLVTDCGCHSVSLSVRRPVWLSQASKPGIVVVNSLSTSPSGPN